MLAEMDIKLDMILAYMKNIDFNVKRQSQANKSTPEVSSEILSPTVVPQPQPLPTVPEITFVEVGNDSKSDHRKVTVHQNVYYPNNKPAVLAKVKILDANKQIVKETKTNNVGKWTAILDPGNYFIHITKAEVADKPKVDHYFEITVSSSKSSLELESKK